MPKQSEFEEAQNVSNFTKIDKVLANLGLTDNEKTTIYEHLSSILHLGSIEFETTDQRVQATDLTKKHVIIAAKLINQLPEELEKAIFFRSIDVPGSEIM